MCKYSKELLILSSGDGSLVGGDVVVCTPLSSLPYLQTGTDDGGSLGES